jgi:hypothetical protein
VAAKPAAKPVEVVAAKPEASRAKATEIPALAAKPEAPAKAEPKVAEAEAKPKPEAAKVPAAAKPAEGKAKPVEAKPSPNKPGKPASAKQQAYVRDLMRRAGVKSENIIVRMSKLVGTAKPIEDLSAAEAATAIDKLLAVLKKRPGA